MTKAEKRLLASLASKAHGEKFGRLDRVELNLRRQGYIMVMDRPGDRTWPYNLSITKKGEEALAAAAGRRRKAASRPLDNLERSRAGLERAGDVRIDATAKRVTGSRYDRPIPESGIASQAAKRRAKAKRASRYVVINGHVFKV